MLVSNLLSNLSKTLKSNSPVIFSGLAIAGVASTSYLTAKATAKSVREIDEVESREGTAGERKERIKERAQLVWKNYIPPVISGIVTAGFIIGSNRASGRQTAAAFAAYSITDKAFNEYKEQVVEKIGEGKEQKIRDEIAQDKITKNDSREIQITTVSGHVLCCELYTGRYFRSDMETLRHAQNELNAILVSQVFGSMDEWYDLIGLPYTSGSTFVGWDSDKLMELRFSTCLGPNGEPCIAFDYNYVKPIHS